jgi:hypothetical protein
MWGQEGSRTHRKRSLLAHLHCIVSSCTSLHGSLADFIARQGERTPASCKAAKGFRPGRHQTVMLVQKGRISTAWVQQRSSRSFRALRSLFEGFLASAS